MQFSMRSRKRSVKNNCFLVAPLIFMTFFIFPDASSKKIDITGYQQRPPEIPRPTHEVRVVVTNVEVVVTDKEGRRVTGLKPENFEIYEDGLLQKLTNFYEVKEAEIYAFVPDKESNKLFPPSQPLSEKAPRTLNKIIFYFDNWHLHPLNRNWALKKMETFIRNIFSPDCHIEGMVVSLDQKLEIVQEFTSNQEILLQALNKTKGRAGQSFMRSKTKEDLRKELNNIVSETERSKRFESYERALDYARNYVYAEQNDLLYSLKSLTAFLDYLAGIEGRKILVYVSDGLSINPSEEVFSFIDQAFPTGRARSETMDYDATGYFKELTARCNSREVALYPINAQGLESSILSADKESGWNVYSRGSGMVKLGSRAVNEALNLMARDTGGLAVLNTNDIESGLKKINDDLQFHYSLGYVSPHREDDKYHAIEVKLAGVKEDYHLRLRHGYMSISPEEKIRESVVSRLFLGRVYNSMEVGVQVLPFERIPGSDSLRLAVKFLIPIKSLTLFPAGDEYLGQINVYIALLDADGNVSPCHELSQEIKIPKKDYEIALKSNFPYIAEMYVKPNRYTISLALQDVLGDTVNFIQLERMIQLE